MPTYATQKKNRIAGLGTRALGLLAAVIDQAIQKQAEGKELTRTDLDAIKFVVNANPGLLRSKAFKVMREEPDDEPKEKSISDLSTAELLEKAKQINSTRLDSI